MSLVDSTYSHVQNIIVDEGSDQQRIDNFLVKKCKGVPKARLYRALRAGEVRVNKGRIGADYRLKLGDMVRIPPLRKREAAPPIDINKAPRRLKDLEQEIIYEDQDILVLNKPSGIAVHGGSGVVLGVIETLRLLRPQAKMLELVHRLDRDTSGCLLVSKKASINKAVQEQFKSKSVRKTYLMLVHGRCTFDQKRVDLPLLRDVLMSGERMVKVNPAGKNSITHFTVLKRYKNATLILANPLTGRTHQLRVHAKAIGHPIIGDSKYGDRELDKLLKGPQKHRLYLHAACLRFQDPRTAESRTFCAVLEPSFAQQLRLLGNPPLGVLRGQ